MGRFLASARAEGSGGRTAPGCECAAAEPWLLGAGFVTRRDDFGPADHKLAAFHRAACALLGPLARDQLAYDGCRIGVGLAPRRRAGS